MYVPPTHRDVLTKKQIKLPIHSLYSCLRSPKQTSPSQVVHTHTPACNHTARINPIANQYSTQSNPRTQWRAHIDISHRHLRTCSMTADCRRQQNCSLAKKHPDSYSPCLPYFWFILSIFFSLSVAPCIMIVTLPGQGCWFGLEL